MNRSLRITVLAALLFAAAIWGPSAGTAYAAEASPAGDIIAIGDPAAAKHVELYLDPLCPYSGKMIRDQGADIGQRIESGQLRIDLRLVDFLDKYSASGNYDRRAIYAAFIVADHSHSSATTWQFIEQIYADGQQPEEGGPTDLSNDQLANLANQVGAPQSAQDMIRIGLPVPFNAGTIAANNVGLLRQLPEPGVPTVIIDGSPVDGNSDWLAKLR